MSTPILATPDETTGWLLETVGNGDNIVHTAVKFDGDGIAVAFKALDNWYVSLYVSPCDGTPLVPATFHEQDDAVAWLTYLANLNTRPAVTA